MTPVYCGTVTIKLAEGLEATPTDLLEGDGGKAVKKVHFKPYDLLSLRIQKALFLEEKNLFSRLKHLQI